MVSNAQWPRMVHTSKAMLFLFWWVVLDTFGMSRSRGCCRRIMGHSEQYITGMTRAWQLQGLFRTQYGSLQCQLLWNLFSGSSRIQSSATTTITAHYPPSPHSRRVHDGSLPILKLLSLLYFCNKIVWIHCGVSLSLFWRIEIIP